MKKVFNQASKGDEENCVGITVPIVDESGKQVNISYYFYPTDGILLGLHIIYTSIKLIFRNIFSIRGFKV